MKLVARLVVLALPCLLGARTAAAQTPDIAPSSLAFDWHYYGSSGALSAYSFGTTLCNVGDAPIAWDYPLDMPVVGQNLFRIADGRIEQLGYGYLAPRFCALNIDDCGTCQPTNCATLGSGCSDVSALHDGGSGWAKYAIDGNRGAWTSVPPGPSGDPLVINGRIQVLTSALGQVDATYVAETQAVSGHDQRSGSGVNNTSWCFVDFSTPSSPQTAAAAYLGEPALFAWRAVHQDVVISEAFVVDEGGPGVHGFMWIASRAIDLGGTWRYEYAVQNTTSEVAVRALSILTPCGSANATSAQFFGIDHHSGSPYSDAAWSFAQTGTELGWSTATFAQNADANALRWGNLFAFSFESDAAPDPAGTVELALFKTSGSVSATAIVPSGPSFSYPAFCLPTATSTGNPIALTASGAPNIAANNLMLTCVDLPPNQFGYFLMSEAQQLSANPPGSQGNLCIGSPFVRFAGNVLNSGASGSVTFEPDALALPSNTTWMPGETWNFQYWTRDGQNPSNFSNLATITFCQ